MYLKNELYELIRTDESIFDFIQESALDGLWYWNLEKPEDEWMNPKFWNVLGYNPDEMPHKSSAWQNIINQDDLILASDNFIKHCENPKHPYDQIVRYTHKDGSTVWIRCRGMAIRDKTGKPIRMLGAHHDITELKIKENELQKAKDKAEESEEKYRALYNNAPLSYQSLDENGCFIDINPMWLRTLGYERDEVIGKWYGDFLHPDYVEHFRINFPAFKKRGYISDVQFKLRRKDNTYITVSFEGCVGYTPEGKFKQTYCVFKDITEQKSVEQKLQDTLNYQNLMLDNDPTLIFFKDCKNNILRVTESVAKATGLTREEIEGRPSKEIYPDMADKYWEDDLEVIKSGKTKYNIVEPLTGVDGSTYWLLTTKVPVKNYSGEIVGICVFASDITDLKNTELGLIAAKEKAEESEEKTRYILKHNPNAIAVFDNQMNILIVSDRFLDDYNVKDNNIIGKNHYEVFPEMPEKWRNVHRRALQGEVLSNDDDYFIRPDGSITYTRWECRPWYHSDNSIGGMIAYTEVITERKLAELALKESERRFDLAMKASNDGLFDWNLETNVIYYSPAWKKMLGYEEHELPNDFSVWENTTDPEDVKKSWELQQKLITKQVDRFVMEFKMKHKAGHWVDILSRAEAIFNEDGKAVRMVGTHTDITERKKQEEQLRLSKELLSETESIGKVGGWSFNIDTMEQKWTDEVFHIHEVEISPNPRVDEGINYYTKESRPIIEKAVQRAIEFGENYDLELEIVTAKGNIRAVHTIGKADLKNRRIYGFFQDITERKWAEEHLQKFKKIVSSTSDGIALLDKNYRYVIVNKAYEKFSGKKQEELIELTVSEYLGEEVFNTFIKTNFDRCLKGEIIKYRDWFEYPTLGKRFIEVTYSPYINANGIIEGVVANSRDITERKLAEEELIKAKEKAEESESRFRSLIENAPDGIVIMDLDGKFKYVSPNAERLFGYNKDEAIGHAGDENTHPDDLPLVLKTIETIFSDPLLKPTMQYRFKKKNGEFRWIETTFTNLLSDKAINGIVLNFTDITVRKQIFEELVIAKEKAEESEAQLKKAQKTAKIGSWIWYIQENKLWWSDEMYHIFDIDKNDFTGELDKVIEKVIHPDDRHAVEDSNNSVMVHNKPIPVEYRIKTKVGASKYVLGIADNIVLDENGKSNTLSGIVKDITDYKLIQIDLQKAKEKAEESDRLKSAFLANMSHEIRTPMNGILGFAYLLKEPDLAGEEQQEYIQMIEKSGKRMLNIINDIIDISKIEAGLMEIHFNDSNINEQIEYIYTFFKPEANAKGLNISFNNPLPTKEAVIKTDREKLIAILTNLVKNALKFTDMGSIEFGYHVNNYSEQKELLFYVKDTGIGIPKDRQSAIFERFIQSDVADKEARQGAGLGLAISKAYIEMLGGNIRVESEVGGGSAFYFTLPVNAEPINETIIESLTPMDKIDSIRKLKILIVEDDEASEKLIERYINYLAKEIIKVRNGVEAVEICRANPDIDLILMDIQMPKLNGYEATKQIREFNKEVIIISQTAYGLTGDREKSLESGCNDYIAKPINKNEFLEIVNKYFGK